MDAVLIARADIVRQFKSDIFHQNLFPVGDQKAEGPVVADHHVADQQVFDSEKRNADDQRIAVDIGLFGRDVVRLVQAVLIVGAAEQPDVAVEPIPLRGISVHDHRPVGMVGLIKPAGVAETFDGRVRMHRQARDQRRAVHHQP